MARPKKNQGEEKEAVVGGEQFDEATPMPVSPTFEEVPKEVVKEELPVQKKYNVERTVERGPIAAKKLPRILSGVCEFCGPGLYDQRTSPMTLVDNWTVDPDTQIGRCDHYRGVRIQCSYCPLSADWKENILRRPHYVFESPWTPGSLIVCCDDMNCRAKHTNRANRGN